MEKILSTKNEQVKIWKKLLRKKGRDQQQAYLLEGFHLVKEALLNHAPIQKILITEEALAKNQIDIDNTIEMIQISPEIAKQLSDTPTTQGIFAIVAIEKASTIPLSGSFLLLDTVQDPGNVGTMIRTADAAGFSAVILGEGSVDIYSGKVLRAMQGSHFHLPIMQGNLFTWLVKLQQAGVKVFGTALDERTIDYREAPITQDFALILGNEGNGVQPDLLKQTDQNLKIPIYGQAESLNVAVAAGILMFHFKKD